MKEVGSERTKEVTFSSPGYKTMGESAARKTANLLDLWNRVVSLAVGTVAALHFLLLLILVTATQDKGLG